METSDIQHLAGLARIKVTDAEAKDIATEFDAILGYVAQVTEVSAESINEPQAGVHRNVFREDTETHEPGVYTGALLAAAPQRDGDYIRVKKILGDTPQ